MMPMLKNLRDCSRMALAVLLACLLCTGVAQAQTRTISGNVNDAASGEALPGVTILEKGTHNGTVTDMNGHFSIEVSGADAVLVASFVGYKATEFAVGDRAQVDIILQTDVLTLDEIVVVGYGQQKKSVVTGAIARVDASDLKASKDLRVEQALQGKAAGVIIMNNSGQPGDNLTIRIRGTGTNGDPDPLFIVDGLPMEKEGLNYLNPADIESMEVLKDAASAAIYGTRGANGVVIITTKKGKKGERFTISYDGYYGVQNLWRKPNLLNGQQYLSMINEAGENDGTGPYFSDAMMDTLQWNTDWVDQMLYKNAPKSSHTISLAGGGEKATFASSLNFYGQDGIMAKGKSNFERITYRLNTTYDLGRLRVGSNLNIVNIQTRGIDGNTLTGMGLVQGLNMPSIIPVRYDNGDFAVPNDFNIGLQEISNPVAMLSYLNSKSTTNKVLGNLYADIDLFKGLTFRANYGTEVAFVKDDGYTPEYYLDPTHYTVTNSASKSFHQYVRWNWDNTLTYQKSVAKHNFTVLAGFTRFKEWDESLSASRDSLIFDDFDYAYLDNATDTEYNKPGNYFSEHTLQSYFGRINYNYDERYLFEGVLRVDGSSRFGKENRYGYFPAASVGWVFTAEDFFPELPALVNFGKLRVSWGRNGNENIGNFQYSALMEKNLNYFFGTGETMVSGIQPDFYPNPNLKWEASEQLDIGIDLKLLSNRITLTFDYYDKRTKDWLITGAPFPLLIGNNGPVVNAGEVKNSGIEVELGYINTVLDDVTVDLKLTASTNKSEVISINNASGSLVGGQGVIGQNDILRAEEGKPLGYFWGYQTEGIFQTAEELAAYPHQGNAHPGDFKFRDTDENGTLDDNDRVNLGTPYPKLILGLNTSFEWRGFDLAMFWYSALGFQIFNANRRADLIYANYTTDVLDRWTGEGTSNSTPRVTLSDPNQTWKRPSDFYIEDGDFLRLKNITLGYNLPKDLLKAFRIQNLHVYVTSENLLTITGYNGVALESGGGPLALGIDHGTYPQARTFIGGINLTF